MAVNTNVAVGATSTTVLNLTEGVSPSLIVLSNASDANVYLSIGSLTAETNKGILLTANGGTMTLDTRYAGIRQISAISSGAGKNLCVCYF